MSRQGKKTLIYTISISSIIIYRISNINKKSLNVRLFSNVRLHIFMLCIYVQADVQYIHRVGKEKINSILGCDMVTFMVLR